MVLRVSLFGLPGAGKGTQAIKLANELNLPHISTGDIFRSLKNDRSSLAEEVNDYVSSGRLVPDELVTKITLAKLVEDECRDGFILDGFPRTLPQAKELMASGLAIDGLINIEVSKDVIIKRLSGRRICNKCASIYNIEEFEDGKPIVCRKDGLPLIQRSDDTPEAVVRRLAAFEENFLPVIKYFDEIGRLRVVFGESDPDTVFREIMKNIKSLK